MLRSKQIRNFPLLYSSCLTSIHHHVLTNNFNLSELQLAISSRKSIVSGLDNISPLMHLPKNALGSLLSIMNNILNNQQIPSSWNFHKIIPIPKQNSNTSFRPIAISSSLCKIFEHMLKSRLDWWLDPYSIFYSTFLY